MHDFAASQRLDSLSKSNSETHWVPDLPSVILGLILGSVIAIVAYKLNALREPEMETSPQVAETSGPAVNFDFYTELKREDLYPATSTQNSH